MYFNDLDVTKAVLLGVVTCFSLWIIRYQFLKKRRNDVRFLQDKAADIESINCGISHSIIQSKGNIFVTGDNTYGEHGNESLEIQVSHNFAMVKQLKNITRVSCGNRHTICIDESGSVWGFGQNSHGQLGMESCRSIATPTQISVPNAKLVACGLEHSHIVDNKGQLWSFGSNYYGQLGIDINTDLSRPTMVRKLSNIKQVFSGGFHVFCIDSSNTIYRFGKNDLGQLGFGVGSRKRVTNPIKWDNLPNIKSFACGMEHTLALDYDGNVYSFGKNINCEIGFEDLENQFSPKKLTVLPKIQKISCGYYHSMCLDVDSNVWVFGSNMQGQLGLDKDIKCSSPIILKNIPKISVLSQGGIHSILKNDCEFFLCGNNYHGQLGIPDTKNRYTIEIVPSSTIFESK